MKNYLRILRFALPYRKEILLSVLFNIIMVFFSLGSITILIPVLKILFQNTAEVAEPAPYEGIINLKVYLESHLNYQIGKWSAENGTQSVLVWILVVATSMFVIKNLTRYLALVCLAYVKNGVERDLRNTIHKKVLHLPLSYFSEQRKGDLIARMSTDITEIQWALLSSVNRMIQDPLMILLTIALLLVLSPKLTVFVIVLIPLTGFVITFIGNSLKKPAKRAKDELGRLLSHIEEHLSGLPIIKSYVAEEKVQQSFERSNNNHFRFMNQVLFRRELSSPVSEVLGSGVIIAIVWFGGYLILNNGELQPEIFITYVVLFYQIINPAKSLSTAIYDIKRGEASSVRILEVLDTPNPLLIQEKALPKPTFDQQIHLRKVSFKYEDQWVVRNLDLTIEKGKTIALVGQSGSGKTTIAKLLNRFYDVNEGAIELDGLDVRHTRLADLRKLIGFISQEAILFNDSIRNNLLLGKENATEEELIWAAKVANAYDFIMETPKGFDTDHWRPGK
jgi:subfamily B ATP-binding cassette protein MsbA